jgi:hypothetical protein
MLVLARAVCTHGKLGAWHRHRKGRGGGCLGGRGGGERERESIRNYFIRLRWEASEDELFGGRVRVEKG